MGPREGSARYEDEVKIMAEYMRWLNFAFTTSADNTYTPSEALEFPVDIEDGEICCLHAIEMDIPDLAGTDVNRFAAQLSFTSQAAMLNMNSSDLIWKEDMQVHVVGAAAEYIQKLTLKQEISGYPPTMLSKRSVFMGALVKIGATQAIYGRIGFTTRRVRKSKALYSAVDQSWN